MMRPCLVVARKEVLITKLILQNSTIKTIVETRKFKHDQNRKHVHIIEYFQNTFIKLRNFPYYSAGFICKYIKYLECWFKCIS